MSMNLLAAGVGDVLPVLFVLIAIATGLINFFREKGVAQQAQQQQVQGGQQQDEDLLVFGMDGQPKVNGGQQQIYAQAPQMLVQGNMADMLKSPASTHGPRTASGRELAIAYIYAAAAARAER